MTENELIRRALCAVVIFWTGELEGLMISAHGPQVEDFLPRVRVHISRTGAGEKYGQSIVFSYVELERQEDGPLRLKVKSAAREMQ